MISVFDFLQDKETPENQLTHRAAFNHFVKNFLWGSSNHIEKFEECTEHHFGLLEEYLKKKTKDLFVDWQASFERLFAYKKPFVINSDVA